MKSKRAISTIVGSVFFLVLMTSGLSVSYMVIETQSDMIEAQQTIADSEIKKIQEKFDFSASTDVADSNRLELYVQNQGSNPLEIDTVWVVDNTSNNAQKYSVNYADAVLSSGYGSELLQNTPLYLSPGDYDIKVVSALGTVKTTKLEVDGVSGGSDLKLKVMVDTPDVHIGKNVTMWAFVTNTGTTNILGVNVGPITVTPPTAVISSSPVLQTATDLAPSESAIFAWKYKISGPDGSNVAFLTLATGTREGGGTIQSNTDDDIATLRQNFGGTGEDVLTDELFAKPEIFLIFPGQFGDDDNFGLWGVNIANPTDQPIYVNKVLIAAQTPRATSSDKVFEKDCHKPTPKLETVPPTPNNWACPDDNILQWSSTNPSTAQKVDPRSVFPFLVKIQPGSIGSSLPDPSAVLIQANVFSTLGQFGKAGYGTTIHSLNDGPIPGVYLSKVAGSTSANDILGNVTRIQAGTNKTFNAVFADFDTGTANKIDANSRLIINIPKGWNDVAIASATGFTTSIQTYPDGSKQIVGVLTGDITGAAGTAKTITFTAEAPPVTQTKMYVMYLLADGSVTVTSPDGPFSIGPLAEIILQVVP